MRSRLPCSWRLRCAVAVSAALCAGHCVLAAPRDPATVPVVEEVETPPTSEWVQRLAGRFTLDGVIHHVEYVDPDRGGPPQVMNEWRQPMGGKADCIAFADAAGLQCVVNLAWPEVWNQTTGRASLGGVSDLTPAMLLAGIDPDQDQLRFLMVTRRGFGYPGRAGLQGNTAITRPACVDLPGVQTCDQKVQVTADAEARILQMVVSTEVRYLRYKRDRDPFIVPSPGEPSYEWLSELLEVAFSVKRDANAPAPAAGS